MFKHQGESRTLQHNLKIASILSFVAGMVNVAGFLSIKQLTTNVTGHFALFINEVSDFQIWKGTVFLFYILSFLFGSFISSFLVETFRNNKKLNVFVIPILMEVFILVVIALFYDFGLLTSTNLIACCLLFAMGVQNSLVTKISNAVVRTTHLTGLFTDLGIDLSHMFFPTSYPDRKKVISDIKLKGFIITFFFSGGIFGGFLYASLNLKLNTLIIAAILLLYSLIYDDVKYSMKKTKVKIKSKIKSVRG